MHRRYADRVQFLAVYTREAHAKDGCWPVPNPKDPLAVLQPRTFEERVKVARRCCAALKVTMPLLVDEIDDRVGHTYSGMPERLYIIDRDGRVAYKGGRGPFGFRPGEMEQVLVMLLLDQEQQPSPARGEKGKFVPDSTAAKTEGKKGQRGDAASGR